MIRIVKNFVINNDATKYIILLILVLLLAIMNIQLDGDNTRKLFADISLDFFETVVIKDVRKNYTKNKETV